MMFSAGVFSENRGVSWFGEADAPAEDLSVPTKIVGLGITVKLEDKRV